MALFWWIVIYLVAMFATCLMYMLMFGDDDGGTCFTVGILWPVTIPLLLLIFIFYGFMELVKLCYRKVEDAQIGWKIKDFFRNLVNKLLK